jgi:hypothetical protein
MGEKLEMLRKFSINHQFPNQQLVKEIATLSFSELQEIFDFVSYAAATRCPFNTDKLIEYLGMCDLRRVDPEQVVDCIEDLASLGLLQPTLGLRLLTSYTSNDRYDSLDLHARGKLSSRVLSSLFLSLLVPPTRHLDQLCKSVEDAASSVDHFDRAVITEMSGFVDNEAIRQLVAEWGKTNDTEGPGAYEDPMRVNMASIVSKNLSSNSVQEIVVGQTPMLGTADFVVDEKDAISLAIPSDYNSDSSLTQLKKFKLFMLQKRMKDVNIYSWINRV